MPKQAPVLSEHHKHRMLAYLARTSFPQRNRMMFQLSWLAGMRVGEIAALNVEDCVGGDGAVRDTIHLKAEQTKGDIGRTVYVNAQLRQELDTYLRDLASMGRVSGPVMTSKTGKRFSANGLCQRFLQLYDKAGFDTATSHSGRRTFITTLANRSVNVRVLAELAGHRNITTTQRYIEINDTVLRQAVELV